MKAIKVSAPGKLHLLGEHAIVYGKPAIIAAVDKRCFVEITSRKDKKIEIVSKNLKASKLFAEKEIVAKTQDAQVKWESYVKTNDIFLLKSIVSDPLGFPAIIVGESLEYLKKKLPFGFTLSIKSDIPVGSGMGSSAALCVSVAGALSLLFSNKLNKETINDIAFLCEQKKHGLPSGGDNAACCFGGLIWYRKETADLKIIKPVPFGFPKKIAKNFLVIHTGTPTESTGEMVSIVKDLYKQKVEFVESILSSQEKLVRELLSVIKGGDDTLMIRIIRVGEKNLESLGVVSEFSKSIIRKIEESGGAAKICGGGGRQRGTGVLLAYHHDKKVVEKIANNFNLLHFTIILGEEGVRREI